VSDLGSVHEAARDALSRGAWEEALVLARGGGDEPDLLDVEAEASWWLGRLDACITAREAAFRLFEARGDRRAAGRVAVRLWEHHMIKVRPAIASAWLRRARRALEDEQDSEAFGNLVLREAELAHGSGDLTGAAQRAREVHALGRRLGSVDLEAEALQTLGRVLIDAGEVAEGLGSLDEAMLSAVEGRLSPYSTGKVLCSMISACEQLGDLRRAAEWTDATLRWSADHPLAMWPGICRVHHAALLQQRGDLVGAEREARRACQDLDGFHVPNVAAGWVEVGEVRRRLGDLDAAEDAFSNAEALTGQQSPGLAMVWLARGRVEAASALIARLLDEQTWNALARGRLLPARAQIAVAAGDLEAAEAATEELERIAREHDGPLLTAAALSARGRVQLARGDVAGACGTLRHALERWYQLEVPYEVATTRLLLAQACRGSGDEEGALSSLAQAAEIFDRLGVAVDTATPDRLPAGLTGREVEVLLLVADGRTNRQVADELHLSERTVARHLSTIFAKTGTASRTAAAAFAFANALGQNSGSGPGSRRTSAPSDTRASTKPS
jgi:ATP/maltotriose-dependent transcriptional regulator MalT